MSSNTLRFANVAANTLSASFSLMNLYRFTMSPPAYAYIRKNTKNGHAHPRQTSGMRTRPPWQGCI
jgi:hypothetical protein